MNHAFLLERTMLIDAIYWQPNERLLTVRTADGGNTQVGGRLTDQELVQVLGKDLAGRIQKPEYLARELSDLAVHALRGADLGYLRTSANGSTCVVPMKDVNGNLVPDDSALEKRRRENQRPATAAEMELLDERLSLKGYDRLYEEQRQALEEGGEQAFGLLDDLDARVGIRTDDISAGMRGEDPQVAGDEADEERSAFRP